MTEADQQERWHVEFIPYGQHKLEGTFGNSWPSLIRDGHRFSRNDWTKFAAELNSLEQRLRVTTEALREQLAEQEREYTKPAGVQLPDKYFVLPAAFQHEWRKKAAEALKESQK